jgi:hypothetical protein
MKLKTSTASMQYLRLQFKKVNTTNKKRPTESNHEQKPVD